MKIIMLIALCAVIACGPAVAQQKTNDDTIKARALRFEQTIAQPNMWHFGPAVMAPDGKWYKAFSAITPTSHLVKMTIVANDSLGTGEFVKEVLLKEEDKEYHWYSDSPNKKGDQKKILAILQ
jgi:transposase-like protein